MSSAKSIMNKNRWRGLSIETRQEYITNEMFVIYPDYLKIAQEIKRRMYKSVTERKGAGVFCSIPSGCGKTNLIKFLRKRWPEDHGGTISEIPVIAFSIPESPTERGMSRALIYSTGSPAWKGGTGMDLFDTSINIIKTVKTKVICIDNVQDIPTKRREGGIRTVGNWIRRLIEDSNRLVVLFGTPAAAAVLDSNSQLRRRTACRLRLDYFAISPPERGSQFRRFMLELDKTLPLAELSGLSDTVFMMKVFWATYGIQDYIFQIINEALYVAVSKGRERILISDMEIAFDNYFQDAGKEINPFRQNGPQRALDREGEPFHNWFDFANPEPSTISTDK